MDCWSKCCQECSVIPIGCPGLSDDRHGHTSVVCATDKVAAYPCEVQTIKKQPGCLSHAFGRMRSSTTLAFNIESWRARPASNGRHTRTERMQICWNNEASSFHDVTIGTCSAFKLPTSVAFPPRPLPIPCGREAMAREGAHKWCEPWAHALGFVKLGERQMDNDDPVGRVSLGAARERVGSIIHKQSAAQSDSLRRDGPSNGLPTPAKPA